MRIRSAHSGQSASYEVYLFSQSRAGRSGRTSGPKKPFVRPENRPTDLRLVDRFQFSPRAVRAFLTFRSVIMWCIVGCDPDVGGARAVITGHDVGFVDTARIFDCPTQTLMVNRRPRVSPWGWAAVHPIAWHSTRIPFWAQSLARRRELNWRQSRTHRWA